MRKAEMSIGIIIAIAIGLLILVIIALLVGGGFRDLTAQTNACEDTFRGTCDYTEEECRAASGSVVSAGSSSCTLPGAVCCQLGLRSGS